MRDWLCFFSQTGSEIHNVCNALERYPDAIVTNKQNTDGVNKDLLTITTFRTQKLNRTIWYQLPVKPTVTDYNQVLEKFNNPLITLHGFLRIVPPEICNQYEIYNLHPGLITKYPSLKGYNPQERAFKDGYKTAGCVIHRVIPQVDSGEILLSNEVSIEDLTLEEVYSKLHNLATLMWTEFLRGKV